ncbi:hypothetical protein niasHT_031652 [Heterodera trifolii]|uniref:BTB domain-containing protein n=1 Tax=Heterodera trifolii TaxID=157864 RepID=A0ABD2J2K6_9BILA
MQQNENLSSVSPVPSGAGSYSELLELCRSNRSDLLILSAEIFAEAASGQAFPFNDSLLVKQHEEDKIGKLISVNKKLLALHSPFFDKLLFGTDQAASSSGTSLAQKPTIVQLDPPSTLEHFQKMIAISILNSMGREDFCDGKNFMEIHNEMNRLGEEAQAEVYARYYELFPEAKKNNNKKARICE